MMTVMNSPTTYRRRPERQPTGTASSPITDADVGRPHSAISPALAARTQIGRGGAPNHPLLGVDGPVAHGIPSGGS